MQDADKTIAETRDRLIDAALPHVPFDGWTKATLDAAIADSGVGGALARSLFPRGAVDLAAAFHRRGDGMMTARLAETDLAALRYSERVALAIRLRLEAVAEHKEAVRRGTVLFALPQNAAQGAQLIWGTADAIWKALGDTSNDLNWYTKRATLSAVYGASALYWLGDTSDRHEATRAFIDRRIADVMRFEKTKADLRKNPLVAGLMKGPSALAERLRARSGATDPLHHEEN
ncbi:MAG: COQ9 family protein [Paracoccaceae bacterium]